MSPKRTLIKSPIWQLVPRPRRGSHSCERLLAGRGGGKRQEEAFLSLSLSPTLPPSHSVALRWWRAGWRRRTTDGKATSGVKTQVTVTVTVKVETFFCFERLYTGRLRTWHADVALCESASGQATTKMSFQPFSFNTVSLRRMCWQFSLLHGKQEGCNQN